MRLHGFPLSPNARRVELGLVEHGVDYELVQVDLAAGAHRTPGFLALNPNGKVPVLETGDTVLTESNAILLWLAETRPEADLGGRTPDERAHVARWLFFNATHMAPASAQIFAHTMFLPAAKRVPQTVESSRHELARCLAIVDAALAGERWLLGDRYTIADISLAPNVYLAKTLLGIAPGAQVARWLADVTARPAWKRVYGA